MQILLQIVVLFTRVHTSDQVKNLHGPVGPV